MEEDQNQIIDTTAKATSASQVAVPKAAGVLTLGILSLVFVGGIGIILGIIALAMSGGVLRTYEADPDKYTLASYKNAKAGKICAIIAICIAGLLILFVAAVAVVAG